MLAFTANPSRDRKVSGLPYIEIAALLEAQMEQVGGGMGFSILVVYRTIMG